VCIPVCTVLSNTTIRLELAASSPLPDAASTSDRWIPNSPELDTRTASPRLDVVGLSSTSESASTALPDTSITDSLPGLFPVTVARIRST
jgi:hypothetical protein